jgi:hypothetical protein
MTTINKFEEIVIYPDQKQRLCYMNEEYQYWLQYWQKRFEKEVAETETDSVTLE